jgi:hypothetical protein
MRESDLVLQLGWLNNTQSRITGIQWLQQWVRSNEGFCSEADTKPVVEAVLRGLGWDTLTGDVAREGDCRLGDFHLYYKGDDTENRRICTLIEAERLHCGEAELKRQPLCQLSGYLKTLIETQESEPEERARWISNYRLERGGGVFAIAVLTTGRRWWIYNEPEGFKDMAALVYPPPIKFDLLDASNLDAVISDLGKKEVCAKVEAFLQRGCA